MSSYEKQMQWKKATTVKSKKTQEEKVAEETYSFAPVFYTQSSSSTRSRDGHKHHDEAYWSSNKAKSNRSKDEQESEAKLRPSKGKPRTQENNDNYVSDVHLNTPEGAVSVDSRVGHHHQQRSPSGDGESGTGYGRSYAESHSHFRSQQYQRKSHRGDNNDTGEYRTGGGIDKEEYEGDEQSAEHSQHSSEKKKEHLLRKPTSRKEKKHTIRSEQGNYSVANGQYLNRTDHKHKHHHQHNRNSNRRHRSESRDSSHSGSRSSRRSTSNSGGSSGSEDDEAEEPIIELLERERKQWREEREKLIQCIHLQQLELTQRSIAAHERAADIAKEFARAIECFEERLVSVEGSVQKEIMSIKTIAEALLQAATK